MWPAFLVLTLVDGVLFVVLPPYEGGPPAVFPGVILALFVNLLAVAVLAPLAGLAVRRRRPDLPRFVAADYAGAGLLAGIALVLVAAGLAHREAHAAEGAPEQAVARAMHDYVISSAPQYQDGLDHIDAIRTEPDHYRACVPGADARHSLCLLVRTDQHPPGITVDTDQSPNGAFHQPPG
jgi:microcompartment protein CcmK/EutM